jgi:hypothetical protein
MPVATPNLNLAIGIAAPNVTDRAFISVIVDRYRFSDLMLKLGRDLQVSAGELAAQR